MKQGITTEKLIFRYRLNVLKDFALSKLKEMRLNASGLYNRLQDWIHFTVKVINCFYLAT